MPGPAYIADATTCDVREPTKVAMLRMHFRVIANPRTRNTMLQVMIYDEGVRG